MTAALTQDRIERAGLVTEDVMAAGAVLLDGAETVFVSETATGLAFDPETPIEVWAPLVVRLIVQHKRIEFALADAINFGEMAYSDIYEQWVQETGLNKRTLQNYARIGRLIEPARRRASVSFSHHAEVVSLPVPEQEKLLDRAEAQGMTRYDLRDAVRDRKRQLEDAAATPDEPLCWTPTRSDLSEQAREFLDQKLAGVGRRHSIGYEAGFIACLVWLQQEDCFKEWRS